MTQILKTIEIFHHTLNVGNRDWTLWASKKGLIRISYQEDQGVLPASWLKTYAPSPQFSEDAGIFDQFGATQLLERYFNGEPVSFSSIP